MLRTGNIIYTCQMSGYVHSSSEFLEFFQCYIVVKKWYIFFSQKYDNLMSYLFLFIFLGRLPLLVLLLLLLLADHRLWKTKSLENGLVFFCAYLVAILVWHRM